MSWQHRSTSQEQMKARAERTPETIGLDWKKERQQRKNEKRRKTEKNWIFPSGEKHSHCVWFCIWNILLRYSAPLMLSIVFFVPSHIQSSTCAMSKTCMSHIIPKKVFSSTPPQQHKLSKQRNFKLFWQYRIENSKMPAFRKHLTVSLGPHLNH